MLLEFRVENHRSIREEQALTMEVDQKSMETGPHVRSVAGHRKPLVCVAAIYGANASGKSNLLTALSYMQVVVLGSHRFLDPDVGMPRDPFGWGPFRRKPSLYEVTFLLAEVRYRYGFVVDDACVTEEWLHAWPNGRKQVWYERDSDSIKFGDALKGENRVIESATRTNSLFLSTAVQLRHKQLLPIYRWFRNLLFVSPVPWTYSEFFGRTSLNWHFREPSLRQLLSDSSSTQRSFPFARVDELEKTRIVSSYKSFLRAADVGIIDFKIARENDDDKRASLFFMHESEGEEAWLPLSEESEGTRTLLRLARPVISALSRGRVLIVDELEKSLHPLVARHVIRQFSDPVQNPNMAQVLFTTHDTNLLGTYAGESSLQREQVWLTEKKRSGATVVYPLTDYRPRKQENLERGYLQGRYGAIPFLEQLVSMAD